MVGNMFNPFAIEDSAFTVSPDMSRELDSKKMLRLRLQKNRIDTELIRLGGNPDIGGFVFDVENLDGYSTKLLVEQYRDAGWLTVLADNKLTLLRHGPVQVYMGDFTGDEGVVHFHEHILLLEVAGKKIRLKREDVQIFENRVDLDDDGILWFMPFTVIQSEKDVEDDGNKSGKRED